MSPHCPAIFLQQARSAGVIAAFGTAQAITGSAANNAAKPKTPTLHRSLNSMSVARPASWTQRARKGLRLPWCSSRVADLGGNSHLKPLSSSHLHSTVRDPVAGLSLSVSGPRTAVPIEDGLLRMQAQPRRSGDRNAMTSCRQLNGFERDDCDGGRSKARGDGS
jgi:hypothetical protein